MKITSFSDCSENQTLALRTTSVTPSAGVFSNQDYGEKGIRTTANCVFGMFIDKFLAAILLGLVAIHLPMPHYPECMCKRSAVTLAVVGVNLEYL